MITETIKCLSCTADIEADSCHCDQCGKEIFLCSLCGKPGDQKFCVFDGNDLAPAQQIHGSVQIPLVVPPLAYIPPQSVNVAVAPVPAKLTLTNNSLGISIDIQPNAVLGRNTGPYVDKLQNYSAISGKHLIFSYEDNIGWSFQDIGSTNGTKYNATNMHWDLVSKCQPNTPIVVTDNTFILIANIEFAVSINYAVIKQSIVPGATQRI